MSREKRSPPGTSDRRACTYSEAAPYMSRFLAFISLQEVLRGTQCFQVELVATGLDEEDERLLR